MLIMNTFDDILDKLRLHFTYMEDANFKWADISSVAFHKVIGNYKSGQRPLQINIDHLKDIFPILESSPILDKWRIRLNAFLSKDNLVDCGHVSDIQENWIADRIEYRRNIQHGYNYLQIANSAGIALLTSLLNVGDYYVFCKKTNSADYFIFGLAANAIENIENNSTFIRNSTDKSIFLFEYFATNQSNEVPQKILFGCPGTGKSREILSIKNNLQAKEFKTTFHPDSDYSTFVGAYKPVMRGDDVRYEFMPQVFTKAYTYAWNNPNENVLLVIEEINRGNCAQIFGDLFQCLDRNANGASEYAIDAEADLAQYLAQTIENQTVVSDFFEANYDGNDCFSKIAFPQNLYIYATMNTSDQSLFPIDSAFKRRWDWQYVPIDYADAKTLSIKIDEETSYNWGDFITIINRKIYETTQSEDKQLGNRFVNPSDGTTISLEQFRSKVMFYLWSEIYKDEQEKNIFQWKQDADYQLFTFNDLFDKAQFIGIIKSFMEYNLVPKNEF